jgi:hypothetical protein
LFQEAPSGVIRPAHNCDDSRQLSRFAAFGLMAEPFRRCSAPKPGKVAIDISQCIEIGSAVCEFSTLCGAVAHGAESGGSVSGEGKYHFVPFFSAGAGRGGATEGHGIGNAISRRGQRDQAIETAQRENLRWTMYGKSSC